MNSSTPNMAGAPPETWSQPLLIFRSLPWSFHFPDNQDQVKFPQVPWSSVSQPLFKCNCLGKELKKELTAQLK